MPRSIEIIGPDEVERRNIITKKELEALTGFVRAALGTASFVLRRKLVESCVVKLERVFHEQNNV